MQTINSLNARENKQNPLQDQIEKYDNTLSSIVNTCSEVRTEIKKTKDDPKLNSLKPRTEPADELCKDLDKVTIYARKQSSASKNFLLYPASSLQSKDNLPKVEGILKTSKSALEELKSDPINDPAIPEQLMLLQELQQKLQETSVDNAKINELARKIEDHQVNFLNARSYFWNNTIGIASLEKSLSNLQKTFEN